jgi:hypothetical protein
MKVNGGGKSSQRPSLPGSLATIPTGSLTTLPRTLSTEKVGPIPDYSTDLEVELRVLRVRFLLAYLYLRLTNYMQGGTQPGLGAKDFR